MSGIFVSYRRTDAASAKRLCERLRAHFGSSSVFWDLDCIPAGEDVTTAIDRAIDASSAVLVIVGRHWNALVGCGRRELADPFDPVRYELGMALARGKAVYPVLIESASMPREADLPARLKAFAYREALELDDARFEFDLGRIVRALEVGVSRPAGRVESWLASSRSPTLARGSSMGVLRSWRAMRSVSADSPVAGHGPYSPLRLTPAQLAKRERDLAGLRRRERDRRMAARRQRPAYFQNPLWWGSALLNATACIGAVAIGEWLVVAAIEAVSARPAPLDDFMRGSAVALALAWALIFCAVSALFYRRDPGRRPSVFLSRGLLGGWTLAVADYAYLAFAAAYPIAPALGWIVARAVTAAGEHHAGLGFEGIGVSALLFYTLMVGGVYLKLAADQAEL